MSEPNPRCSSRSLRRGVVHSVLAAAALCLPAAGWAGVPGLGSWETTLQPRDLDRDGVVDAYYDTDLHLTWLADLKAGAGTPYDAPFGSSSGTDGLMSWGNAMAWAASLTLGGVSGWRLPYTNVVGGDIDWPPEDLGVVGDLNVVELQHMYYLTLGLTGSNGQNDGPFLNFGFSMDAWTGTNSQAEYGAKQYLSTDGLGGPGANNAWAVHDGDVAAIPEPQSWALLLCGVAALGLKRWSRSSRQVRKPVHRPQ